MFVFYGSKHPGQWPGNDDLMALLSLIVGEEFKSGRLCRSAAEIRSEVEGTLLFTGFGCSLILWPSSLQQSINLL